MENAPTLGRRGAIDKTTKSGENATDLLRPVFCFLFTTSGNAGR